VPAEIYQNLRYGLRALHRNPVFASVAILSLALGIGATVAIYAVLDAVVLRPLPVKQPERLILVQLTKPQGAASSFSYPLFRQMRAEQNVLEDMLGASEFDLRNVSAGERKLDTPVCRLVTRNYFKVLGVNPARGRFFDDANAMPVVVISNNLWKRAFHQAPDVIGSTLRVNDAQLLVAGITPPEFLGESAGVAPDLFVPLDLLPRLMPGADWLEKGGSYWLWVIGRLKPGVPAPVAAAALERMDPGRNMRIRTEPGAQGLDHLRQQYGRHLEVLAAAAGLLLLVACANVANLLLARGTARQKEIAVRQAMGAGPGRVVRQLLTESLLLSVIAGGLGTVLAMEGSHLLIGFVSFSGQPVQLRTGPDFRVLGFTLALCLLTTLLFGLAPALRAGRIDLPRSISSGWQGQRGSGKYLAGRALVAAQAALSVVLLAGTALLVQSLGNLRGVNPGFVAKDVTVAQLSFVPTVQGLERLIRLSDPLEARLRAMPGVRAATVSTYPILSKGWQSDTLAVAGRPAREGGSIHVNQVTPGFFETYRIRLVRGRTLAPSDGAAAARVAVVNERLAQEYLGGQDPIGRQVSFGSGFDARHAWTIVGVVRNTKYHDLREPMLPQIYLPISQAQAPGVFIGVRTVSGTSVSSHQLRVIVGELDDATGIQKAETLAAHVESTLEKERLMVSLGLVFGFMALALACCGIYGTMAYSVSRRTKEIGLRMALGAAPLNVQSMVLREALWPASIGLAAGLPLALGAAYVVRSMLYGIAPTSPAALSGAALTVLVAAFLAAWLPARWASRLDPMEALRSE